MSNKNNNHFVITSVHRDDLERMGFDTANVTDSDMEDIARRMSYTYTESVFWNDLEFKAWEIGIPKRKKAKSLC